MELDTRHLVTGRAVSFHPVKRDFPALLNYALLLYCIGIDIRHD